MLIFYNTVMKMQNVSQREREIDREREREREREKEKEKEKERDQIQNVSPNYPTNPWERGYKVNQHV